MHSQLLTVSRVLSTAVTWVSQKRSECALRRWGEAVFPFLDWRTSNLHRELCFDFSSCCTFARSESHTEEKRPGAGKKLLFGFCSLLFILWGRTVSHNTPTSFVKVERRNLLNSIDFVCAKPTSASHYTSKLEDSGRISTISSGLDFCSLKPWLIIIYWDCKEAKPDWNGHFSKKMLNKHILSSFPDIYNLYQF